MIAVFKIAPPQDLVRGWLQHPHAPTAAFFSAAVIGLLIAAWMVLRNLRRNEPGLTSSAAFALALIIAGSGTAGAERLNERLVLPIGGGLCAIAGGLSFFADRHRFVRDPQGQVVADRWQIVLHFAHFRWTRDKLNRHFFISGETGAGKTSGMNQLLTALFRRDPRVGGVVMANKGDEWFFLQWLAKKCGREGDIIRLRPRAHGDPAGQPLAQLNVTGDIRFPFTTRARVQVDTAAALNPKDERSFFKTKGAATSGARSNCSPRLAERPLPRTLTCS